MAVDSVKENPKSKEKQKAGQNKANTLSFSTSKKEPLNSGNT